MVADSKIGLMGVSLSVSLRALRVSMSVVRIAVIVWRWSTVEGMPSALEDSEVAMVQGDG